MYSLILKDSNSGTEKQTKDSNIFRMGLILLRTGYNLELRTRRQ